MTLMFKCQKWVKEMFGKKFAIFSKKIILVEMTQLTHGTSLQWLNWFYHENIIIMTIDEREGKYIFIVLKCQSEKCTAHHKYIISALKPINFAQY